MLYLQLRKISSIISFICNLNSLIETQMAGLTILKEIIVYGIIYISYFIFYIKIKLNIMELNHMLREKYIIII